jgi:hypothetical protein
MNPSPRPQWRQDAVPYQARKLPRPACSACDERRCCKCKPSPQCGEYSCSRLHSSTTRVDSAWGPWGWGKHGPCPPKAGACSSLNGAGPSGPAGRVELLGLRSQKCPTSLTRTGEASKPLSGALGGPVPVHLLSTHPGHTPSLYDQVYAPCCVHSNTRGRLRALVSWRWLVVLCSPSTPSCKHAMCIHTLACSLLHQRSVMSDRCYASASNTTDVVVASTTYVPPTHHCVRVLLLAPAPAHRPPRNTSRVNTCGPALHAATCSTGTVVAGSPPATTSTRR